MVQLGRERESCNCVLIQGFEKFDLPNMFFVLLHYNNDCHTKIVFYVYSILRPPCSKSVQMKECKDY